MPSRVDRGYSSTTDNYSRQTRFYVREQPRAGMSNNPWIFENPWSHGLCNITDPCDETCYALCCFPCFSCHLAWRMNESCWIVLCVPSSIPLLRTKMRTTFRINGSYLIDFCVGECCPLCAVLQMANELRFRRLIAVN